MRKLSSVHDNKVKGKHGVTAFAGLRTLCFAKAEISLEFYNEWRNTFYKASTSIQNREKKLEEAAELIERV